MRELIRYLSPFEAGLASKVRGVGVRRLEELTARVHVPLPAEYSDFILTMGEDAGPMRFFDGLADFGFATVLDFYSSPGWRPPRGAIFIGSDGSGSGTDYFLEPAGPGKPMQVVSFPCGDDDFAPIPKHPGFANMLFTLGFLTLRLQRLPQQALLAADGDQPWDPRRRSRWEELADAAPSAGLEQVPHTGSWSVAYNGERCGVVYYQMPRYSPTVNVGAATAAELNALTGRITRSLAMVRVS